MFLNEKKDLKRSGKKKVRWNIKKSVKKPTTPKSTVIENTIYKETNRLSLIYNSKNHTLYICNQANSYQPAYGFFLGAKARNLIVTGKPNSINAYGWTLGDSKASPETNLENVKIFIAALKPEKFPRQREVAALYKILTELPNLQPTAMPPPQANNDLLTNSLIQDRQDLSY